MQGLGKKGDLSLVLIVQATAEEVHRAYCGPRHNTKLRWRNASLQGPLWGKRLDLDYLDLTPRFVKGLAIQPLATN